ncbi:hypothetical protein [Haloarchaeobius iranensis]|uniref:Uncharacterized protein n=1 Tax=Haloarchaeobius iranensis TaxID=996166 RepID=A0A1G9WXD8_9EURY|nr:hypothetical protein [Haloarchaeobius iranensis]SDM88941.1 hypothetical protein SAMN05192554_10926 [Haloarchaeobius iranensis]
MDRRRFLRRAAGVGSCIALAGCAEFGDPPRSGGGPEDLLVTGIDASPHGENVSLGLDLYVDRTVSTDLEAEGEVTVDDRTARAERTVQLSGERKYVSVQLLFSDVSTGSQLPESVWARARVGYGGEMTDWHELTI